MEGKDGEQGKGGPGLIWKLNLWMLKRNFDAYVAFPGNGAKNLMRERQAYRSHK